MYLWLIVIIIPCISSLTAYLLRSKYSIVPTLLSLTLTLIPPLHVIISKEVLKSSIVLKTGIVGDITLWLTGIGSLFAITITVVSICVAIYSLPYITHRVKELGRDLKDLGTYYMLYLLYITGLLGIVYSANTILMFIFLELSVISSFILIMLYGYGNRLWVAIMYFIWSQIASLTFLVGIILLGQEFTYNIPEMINKVSQLSLTPFWLILIGLFIKMGTFLVHLWLPHAHAEAPSPVSAILSPVHVGLMTYIIIYVLFPTYHDYLEKISSALLTYGIVTGIFGASIALIEKDLKRLLAYSTITHMGCLVIAISAVHKGIIAVVLTYIAHALAKSVLFMCAGELITRFHGLRNLELMGGFYEKIPFFSITELIGFITLSGVFNIGLISKFFLTIALINVIIKLDLSYVIFFTILYILLLMLSVAYSFLTVKRTLFGEFKIKVNPSLPKIDILLMEIPTFTLALISIVLMYPYVLEEISRLVMMI